MALQQICEDVISRTEGTLGCLLLDLDKGLILALARRTSQVLDDVDIERIVMASDSLFRGNLMGQFSASLTTGTENGAVHEAQLTRAYSYEFMTSMPDWDGALLVLITERTLSIGLGWMVVNQTRGWLAEAHRNGARESPSGEGASGQAHLEQGDRYRERSPVPTVGRRPAAHRNMADEPSAAVESPRLATPADRQHAPKPVAPKPVAPKPAAPKPAAQKPAAQKPTAPTPSVPPRVVRADRGTPHAPHAPNAKTDEGGKAAEPRELRRGDNAPGAEATAPAEQPGDEPDSTTPFVSGPRAKMFRPRRSKS